MKSQQAWYHILQILVSRAISYHSCYSFVDLLESFGQILRRSSPLNDRPRFSLSLSFLSPYRFSNNNELSSNASTALLKQLIPESERLYVLIQKRVLRRVSVAAFDKRV